MLSVAFADWLWALWTLAVNKHQAFRASIISMLIYAMGLISIFNILENLVYVIPAIAGAFIGTYLAVKGPKRGSNA